MTPADANVIKLLASDVRAARRRLHMTVAVLASQIGISESALRRIENGTSRNTHGDTWLAIMLWAGSRGYRKFAGFSISKTLDRVEVKLDEIEAARTVGERFEALRRSE